jgi:hypothetical protein
MNNNFLFSVILIICLSCNVSFFRSDCYRFYSGSYIYKEDVLRGVKIERNQHKQIETIGDTLIAYFIIEWQDKCSYNLIPEKVLYKSIENLLPKDTIHVSIIEISSDSSYRYRAITKKDTVVHTMIKVNE